MFQRCQIQKRPIGVASLALILFAVGALILGPALDFAAVGFNDHDQAINIATNPTQEKGSVSLHDHNTCGTGPTCTPAVAEISGSWTKVRRETGSYFPPDLSDTDIWAPDAREPVPIA